MKKIIIVLTIIVAMMSCKKEEINPVVNQPVIVDTVYVPVDTLITVTPISTVDTVTMTINNLERTIQTNGEIITGDHYLDNEVKVILDEGEYLDIDIIALPCLCANGSYTLDVFVNSTLYDTNTESYPGFEEYTFNYYYKN